MAAGSSTGLAGGEAIGFASFTLRIMVNLYIVSPKSLPFCIQALLNELKRSTASPSILTLSLSITSVTVTLTETQRTELTQLLNSFEQIISLMDEEIGSLSFSLFVSTGSIVSSLQISGRSHTSEYDIKESIPGGSLTATVDSAATHLLGDMKTVSLNMAAVSSVMTQIILSLSTAPGTATSGKE